MSRHELMLNRADCCGVSAAFDYLHKDNGLELKLCAHHMAAHDEKLRLAGFIVCPLKETVPA